MSYHVASPWEVPGQRPSRRPGQRHAVWKWWKHCAGDAGRRVKRPTSPQADALFLFPLSTLFFFTFFFLEKQL